MKKVLVLMVGVTFLGLQSCDNAANKIKTEAESSTSEVENSVTPTATPAASAANSRTVTDLVGAEGNAQFAFAKESHDFGVIDEGTIAKHDFTFTNTGDSPLIITNASGSCGCTVPSWPREPIAPGETGTIHVEFNSTNRTGAQTKQVTLTANTTPNKKILSIRAQVTPKAKEGEVQVQTEG